MIPTLEVLESRLAPATVINTLDAGAGSLRAALAGAMVGELINFNIPRTDPGYVAATDTYTIAVTKSLDVTTKQVTIDASTQKDKTGVPIGFTRPIIELNGTGAAAGSNGLTITASGVVVKGLVINRFTDKEDVGGNGIEIRSVDGGVQVQGCYLGTDVTGTVAKANTGHGVFINISPNNTVGGSTVVFGKLPGNVISGNTRRGVYILGEASKGNKLQGNLIGTMVNGTNALGNGAGGVLLEQQASGNFIGGANLGNVISGHTDRSGIVIQAEGTNGNIIQGNLIGTDRTGTAAVPNLHGVTIDAAASDNQVGGKVLTERNVISGNELNGVVIRGKNTKNNRVQGNFIGTKANGNEALGNRNGVRIEFEATDNLVGGPVSNPGLDVGNVISGNFDNGVWMFDAGSKNQIQGNLIGTGRTGATNVGNDTGVRVEGEGAPIRPEGTPSTIIGGTVFVDPMTKMKLLRRNIISANRGNGVYILISARGIVPCDNQVIANYIGLDLTGRLPLGNAGNGVQIENGASNVVSQGNVISANSEEGVYILGSGSMLNRVEGNFIGTDASGERIVDRNMNSFGNFANGVLIFNGSKNIVGGTLTFVRDRPAGDSNVIGGNGLSGVEICGPNAKRNQVTGNLIGITYTSQNMQKTLLKIGNKGAGVSLTGQASNNIIGGAKNEADPARKTKRNAIGDNKGGVILENSGANPIRNTILTNTFVANRGLAIDLGNDGITLNDPGDPDEGPNRLQNFPVLLTATASPDGSRTFVTGMIDSDPAFANYPLIIEFYDSYLPNEDGIYQGENFLASIIVSGPGLFSADLPAASRVLATATDSGDSDDEQDGNTSEFSMPIEVSGQPANVTNQLLITLCGFRFNYATGRFVQILTLQNTTDTAIPGPVSLVLDDLTPGVTLFNATGSTTAEGSPFVNIDVGDDGMLSPGEVITVALEFVDPLNVGITYTLRALAGAGAR